MGDEGTPAPGVGMKIVGDNFPDVFQPPAQVLPGADFTYNVAISLCPLMCFFPIERFNAANHRRQKAERGTSAAFCRPSAFVLLGMIGFFPLSE
jgi:hypothetical protein